jgi:hypothetical protein
MKGEKSSVNRGSRSGKHRPENVLMGAFVTPRKKAITMITCAVVAGDGKMSISDLMWRGVENIARTVGVLDANGEVAEKYRDVVKLTELTIVENQKARRARHEKK